jgi:hypothetical protein
MKRPAMILLVATILMPLVGSTLEGQQRFPEVLYSTDPGVQSPVWISADLAIDPSGVIHEKLYSAPERSTIESYLTEPDADGCFRVAEYFESPVDPPDRSSLDRAAKHSDLVLIGRVTAAAYGFHSFVPGQLLRIEPSQVLHGEALLDFYYVFFPVGEFSAGPYRICKVDSRYPRPPDIGDELLIMVPDTHTRSLADPYLELDEASSVVAIPREGAVRLPPVFRDPAEKGSTPVFKSKAELVAAVRKALSKKEMVP